MVLEMITAEFQKEYYPVRLDELDDLLDASALWTGILKKINMLKY